MGTSRLRWFVLSVLPLLGSLACSLSYHTETQVRTEETVGAKPLVLVLAPVNNSVFAEGIDVQLHAIAQDSLAGVARIEFRLNELATIGEVTASNPSGDASLDAQIVWRASGKQAHQLIVEAFRADGSSLGESAIRITITDAPTAAVLSGGAAASPAAASGDGTNATPIPTLTPSDLGILPGG